MYTFSREALPEFEVSMLKIPLAPPAEQDRIVSKVRQLLDACLDLEDRLDRVRGAHALFAISAAAGLT